MRYLVLAAVLLQTACASSGESKALLDSWVGAPSKALVASWGPPTSVSGDAAHQVLVYDMRRTAHIPGKPAYSRPSPGGGTVEIPGLPAVDIQVHCVTTFHAEGPTLRKWTQSGNDCVATPGPAFDASRP